MDTSTMVAILLACVAVAFACGFVTGKKSEKDKEKADTYVSAFISCQKLFSAGYLTFM